MKYLSRRKRNSSKLPYQALELRQLLAVIAWSSGDITGNSDVSTDGTLIFALNGSDATGPTTTVNGVDFVASNRANAGAQAQTQSPGNESITTTLGNENGDFFLDGGLTSSIGDLIEGAWIGAAAGDSASVSLTGLTVGSIYEVQLFASDTRNAVRDNEWITVLDNGAGGTGINLELNNTPTGDQPGDFGIGTFTADSSTQSFNLTGLRDGASNVGRIQVNAIQLRKLDTAVLLPGAVPLINEFSASNSDVLDDDNGNSSDWIEIYNAGEDPVNLGGYSLTDDPTLTNKYVFPSTTVAGGEYLVVFAADDAAPNSGSDLYTSFGLSSSGDYLGFYDPAGNLVNEFGAGGADYPVQVSDVSYGYLNDGAFNAERYFSTATPGGGNGGNAFLGFVAETTASVERGFYDVAFTVDLQSATSGATLVYTTDGTEPSLSNGVQVLPTVNNLFAETTLTVSTTTSLRSAAFRTGFLTQGSTTNTYVFLDDTIANDLDSDITEDPRYENLIRDALLDIPTLSFNYDNVIEDGDTPEQLASIEWLAPDGSTGFQIDAGINAFGGNVTNFAKKSFRLHFRSEYGDSRLNFPIFEGIDDSGIIPATDSFDQLEFRSGSHDMTQRGFYHSNRFVDDTILDAGHVSPHGRFVHIYTNGVYWGQYHMRERWNADFLAQYYGGDKDDYTALNGNRNNGNDTPFQWDPGVVYDGDDTVWNQIHLLAGTFNNTVPTGGYQELKQVVNMEQYIDFMLIYMAGASESEYRAVGATDGSEGYIFYLNDADGWLRDPLGISNLRQGGDKTDNPGPLNILGTLVEQADPEFMTFYADRIQKMFFGDGPLTVESSLNRLQERMDEVELSILTEKARWGFGTIDSYNSAADIAINTRLPALTQSMIDRLRAQGVFPDFDAPTMQVDGSTSNGGDITTGASLTFSASAPIYYTTDGTDPRLVGGGVSPSATLFNSGTPFILNTSTNVQARALNNGQWSAVNSALFAIPASQSDLRISELHFNPADPSAAEIAAGYGDNDDFEFIEIYNSSTTGTINLSGLQLSDGVTFDFNDTDLLPGERAVVVEDVDAFMQRYGDSANVLGEWSGSLNNGGEEVTLLDSSLTEIMSVNYGDGDPWYGLTDGDGYSLVLDDPGNTPIAELGKYYSWRASSELGGTPGETSAQPLGVVINEVLAHTDALQSDSIELFNTTGSAIDIGGWFLSDSSSDLPKFQIPFGTIVGAGSYLVFSESDFNPNPAAPGANDFALSSKGDEIYLARATGFNNTTGFEFSVEDSVEFGATFIGESLGLLPNGSGRLTRLASTSLGSTNGDAEVGPLVISEVNYHPDSPSSAALAIDPLLTDNDLEYIEIANPTSNAIDLTNWRVRGEADYDFAAGTSLAAGSAIVLVSFDPSLAINANKLAAFEAHYGITSGVTIVGGLSATLSNGTGRVSLQQPDTPAVLGVIPHVVVDELVYDDLAPWPDADGNGLVLERDDVSASGLLSGSWTTAAPTPGSFEHDFLCGDINQDGFVTFLDISPFIDLLASNAFQVEADFNSDGLVTFLDIAGFIDKLAAQ